jgi:hypothetical protein
VLIPCLDYFLPLEFLFSSRDISPARGSQFRSGSQIQRRFVQYIDFPLRFPPVDRSRSRAGIPARFHRWFSFLPLSESVTGQFPRQVARPDSPFYTSCHYCLRVFASAVVLVCPRILDLLGPVSRCYLNASKLVFHSRSSTPLFDPAVVELTKPESGCVLVSLFCSRFSLVHSCSSS